MKILNVIRWVTTSIGVCSLVDGSGIHLKIGQTTAIIMVLISYFTIQCFTGLYLVEHIKVGDFDGNLLAWKKMIGTLPTVTSFISLVYRMKSVREFFDNLQTIFDQCK